MSPPRAARDDRFLLLRILHCQKTKPTSPIVRRRAEMATAMIGTIGMDNAAPNCLVPAITDAVGVGVEDPEALIVALSAELDIVDAFEKTVIVDVGRSGEDDTVGSMLGDGISVTAETCDDEVAAGSAA
jgi:hypothetical protein